MAESDDDLRAAYRTLAAAPSKAHPDDAQWERWACGTLDGDERLRLADHVARCAECADVWRAVQALRASAPRARVLPFRPRVAWGAGLAAAAALALALVLPSGDGPTVSGVGSAPATHTLRSAGAEERPGLREPRGRLVAAPVALHWTPVSGARAYRVQLMGADGVPLWSGTETTRLEVAWPAGVAAAPGRYYWQVIALVGADDERPSELTEFEIAPR
jgi:hypothetical protein